MTQKRIHFERDKTGFVRVVEQTHRGNEFGDDADSFWFEEKGLLSCERPENRLDKEGSFFVRGGATREDNSAVSCADREWTWLQGAEAAYNKHFSGEKKKPAPKVVKPLLTARERKILVRTMLAKYKNLKYKGEFIFKGIEKAFIICKR